MRILICQTYGLGNAILTTPMVQALALVGDSQRKPHEIHVAMSSARKGAIEVMQSCPGVAKVWMSSDITGIKKQRFDVLIMCVDEPKLIDLYGIPRIQWAFIPRERGESREAWYQRWTTSEMELAFRVARVFGYKGDMPTPHVPFNPSMTLDSAELKLGVGIGYYKGDSFSCKKHWGNERFAEISRRFAMLGGRTFLLGDAEDQERDGRAILKLAPGVTTSLCGKLGLRGTFSALKSCDVYIGNDTGLSHAAAAFGMPTLAIFKPWHSSYVKNGPIGPKASYACEWPGMNVTDAVWRWITNEAKLIKEARNKHKDKKAKK